MEESHLLHFKIFFRVITLKIEIQILSFSYYIILNRDSQFEERIFKKKLCSNRQFSLSISRLMNFKFLSEIILFLLM